MYEVKFTTKFKKDYKKIIKQGYDITLLKLVVSLLAENKQLPQKYKDHALNGDWIGHRECHVLPDWLLIYKVDNDILVLTLTRTGSHSELFN